jgi:uncharacterized membrane protein YkvA (DUF1232 family)
VSGVLIGLGVAALIYLIAVAALLVAGRRTAAREVALLLPNLALLFKGLIADPRVPNRSKALLLFGVAWIASPIDLIPEFVPFLGPLDDAVVVALILRRLGRTAGRGTLARRPGDHRATAGRRETRLLPGRRTLAGLDAPRPHRGLGDFAPPSDRGLSASTPSQASAPHP